MCVCVLVHMYTSSTYQLAASNTLNAFANVFGTARRIRLETYAYILQLALSLSLLQLTKHHIVIHYSGTYSRKLGTSMLWNTLHGVMVQPCYEPLPAMRTSLAHNQGTCSTCLANRGAHVVIHTHYSSHLGSGTSPTATWGSIKQNWAKARIWRCAQNTLHSYEFALQWSPGTWLDHPTPSIAVNRLASTEGS